MDPTLPTDAFGSLSAPTGAPSDTSTPAAAAADPSSGAGWKQGAQALANNFNNTIGTLKFGQNGAVTSGNPQQQAKPPAPTSGSPTLSQQAQVLLQKGLISQEQYQRIMASIGGGVPSTGMPEMIQSQSTQPGMAAQAGAAAGQAAPPIAQPYANPVNGSSPISPAWGG